MEALTKELKELLDERNEQLSEIGEKAFDQMQMHIDFYEAGHQLTYETFIVGTGDGEDDGLEMLKEAVTNFNDQIDASSGVISTDILTAIKKDQDDMKKKLDTQQLERNRSIILEILDTIDSFTEEVKEKFNAWRADDMMK